MMAAAIKKYNPSFQESQFFFEKNCAKREREQKIIRAQEWLLFGIELNSKHPLFDQPQFWQRISHSGVKSGAKPANYEMTMKPTSLLRATNTGKQQKKAKDCGHNYFKKEGTTHPMNHLSSLAYF